MLNFRIEFILLVVRKGGGVADEFREEIWVEEQRQWKRITVVYFFSKYTTSPNNVWLLCGPID